MKEKLLDQLLSQTPGLPIFSMEFFSGVIWFVLKTAGVIFFILLPTRCVPKNSS